MAAAAASKPSTNREPSVMADLARRIVSSGVPGTLSTLFSAHGSTYRALGSMMVSVPGIRAGGISGGCLDDYVARVGERATRTIPATILNFSSHSEAQDHDIPDTGCGGSIDILVERLAPAHVLLLEQFVGAAARDDASMLASVVRRDADASTVARGWTSCDGPCPTGIDSE